MILRTAKCQKKWWLFPCTHGESRGEFSNNIPLLEIIVIDTWKPLSVDIYLT